MLTVVIGTYNRLPQLKRCMSSLLNSNTEQLKIFVADAGSNDGTCEYLKELAEELKGVLGLQFDGERIGQAKSLNRVFEKVDTKYVCWLSDDNEVAENILNTAISVLEGNRDIGLMGLKVKDLEGPHRHMDYVGGVWPSGIFTVNQGIIRTELFRKLSFFDEKYRDYGIDGDLTTRVLLEGYKVVLTKSIGVYHSRNHSEHPGAIGGDDRSGYMRNAMERYSGKFPALCNRSGIEIKKGLKSLAAGVQFLLLKTAGKEVSVRDAKVLIKGRYIKCNDLWKMRNRDYYLVQYPIENRREQ